MFGDEVVEGEFVVVEPLMTARAHEGELIDVGLALNGSVERVEVMCLAARHISPTPHTPTVTNHEGSELGWAGMATVSAMPKDVAGLVEYGASEHCATGVTLENSVG